MALELLLVFTIALAIIGPLYFFTFVQSTDNIRISKTQSAVDTLGRGVDYVYSLNKGTITTVTIELPDSIISYNLTSKTIINRVNTTVGTTSIFYTTRANVTGSLPTGEGRHVVTLNNTGIGVSLG